MTRKSIETVQPNAENAEALASATLEANADRISAEAEVIASEKAEKAEADAEALEEAKREGGLLALEGVKAEEEAGLVIGRGLLMVKEAMQDRKAWLAWCREPSYRGEDGISVPLSFSIGEAMADRYVKAVSFHNRMEKAGVSPEAKGITSITALARMDAWETDHAKALVESFDDGDSPALPEIIEKAESGIVPSEAEKAEKREAAKAAKEASTREENAKSEAKILKALEKAESLSDWRMMAEEIAASDSDTFAEAFRTLVEAVASFAGNHGPLSERAIRKAFKAEAESAEKAEA